ncbi:MAG: EAL domain-containing protein [Eubacterium sp.]|nr:EAL domain-containing protein [Eubacterium sp.]
MEEFKYEKLTGLPTIFYFFELAEEFRKTQLEAGENPTMLFIDLNGMKNYNARYGFVEGDRLICAMADIIREFFGEERASRFGGDHYAVLTLEKGLKELLSLFMDACKHVNEGQNLPLNIGIYKNSIEDVPASTAIDRAKMACDVDHGNKTSHYTYFNETMLEQLKLRQHIIDNFDRALEEEWIQVYYQPIIRAVNGHVCDEESLARWFDPEKGMLSPADFIPVLEDAKLIHKLDLYMLRKTLQKQEHLKKNGLHRVPASINLSRVDFEVCDIVEEVRKIVDDSEIDRNMITIEITESVLGSNFDYIRKQIERFRIMGFQGLDG